MVRYISEQMDKFKSDYTICNEEIIKSLKRINDEFKSVEEILQTPKSQKNIPVIIDFLVKEIDSRENDLNINIDKLNYIISTYDETIVNITSMVGDKNDK